MDKQPAAASYWAHRFDATGAVAQWMWNCEEGDGVGVTATEAECVEAMNAHMQQHHADGGYLPPPVPE